jgi:hypothetical protein
MQREYTFSSIYRQWLTCCSYPMDTATYAAAAALPWNVIQHLKRPCDPEADFLPFDLSEVARSWHWRFQVTGPCNDI